MELHPVPAVSKRSERPVIDIPKDITSLRAFSNQHFKYGYGNECHNERPSQARPVNIVKGRK